MSRKCKRCGAAISGVYFKRFCSDNCRQAYHNSARALGVKLLEDQQEAKDKTEGVEAADGKR